MVMAAAIAPVTFFKQNRLCMGRPRKYKTDEEAKAAKRAQNAEWRKNNPEYMSEWRKNNLEKFKENIKRWQDKNDWNSYMSKYMANRRLEPMGRAKYLELNYKRLDEENHRGECTLTAEWIVENIFTKPCHYCGETDWKKLGCDRIDNSLPHTPDNVVPCCGDCNAKRGRMTYDKFIKQRQVCELELNFE